MQNMQKKRQRAGQSRALGPAGWRGAKAASAPACGAGACLPPKNKRAPGQGRGRRNLPLPGRAGLRFLFEKA